MKLTKKHLHTLIKEAVEQERLYKIVPMLTSDDLSVVEQGVELAISMGYKVELQRAPSGFRNKEYNIFTPSEELYNAITSLGKHKSAGLVPPENREFVITIRAQ